MLTQKDKVYYSLTRKSYIHSTNEEYNCDTAPLEFDNFTFLPLIEEPRSLCLHRGSCQLDYCSSV